MSQSHFVKSYINQRTSEISTSCYHRDILLEATSSQKVCATSVSSGDQGGTLGQ